MQTIFITGSSSGLGKAAAQLFAVKGWRVIATMRNPEKETELNGLPNLTLLPLDITDPEQIKNTVGRVTAMGDIDVVFNNAGYGLVGPLEGTTDAQIMRQINTNLLGVIRTTQAFIPHFRTKKSGLFITTTSIGGLAAFPFNSIYHATKWALEGWSESLAFELNKFGIGIKTVSPGGIKTDFVGRSLDMSRHEAYDQWVGMAMNVFSDPGKALAYSDPKQIAAVVYEAATDGKDQLRYQAGEDAKEMYARRLQMGAETSRKEVDQLFFGK